MSTIASGEIILTTVSDGYSVTATPESFVLYVDPNTNTVNKSVSCLRVQIKRGNEIIPCLADSYLTVGCTIDEYVYEEGCLCIYIDEYSPNVNSGYVEADVTTIDNEFTTSVRFNFCITHDSAMLDWVQDWNGSKTKVAGSYIMTPKLFIGTREGNVNGTAFNSASLTGVYMGVDILGVETSPGLYGYKGGKQVFSLNSNGGKIGGWSITKDGIETTDEKLKILSSGTIESYSGSNVVWGIYKTGEAIFANGNVKFHANGDAEYEGAITATSGTIGGWNINTDAIFSGADAEILNTGYAREGELILSTSGIRAQGWKLECDGSGALANDAIRWDTNGNINISGDIKVRTLAYDMPYNVVLEDGGALVYDNICNCDYILPTLLAGQVRQITFISRTITQTARMITVTCQPGAYALFVDHTDPGYGYEVFGIHQGAVVQAYGFGAMDMTRWVIVPLTQNAIVSKLLPTDNPIE